MFRISLDDFEQEQEHHGVYIFSEKDGCSLCTRFIEMLNKDYSVDDWYLIELSPDKLDYVRKTYSFNGFPSTVFYHHNEIKWKKSGALFSVQLRNLNKTIIEYDDVKIVNPKEKLTVEEIAILALGKISNPISYLRDEAFSQGMIFDGSMAIEITKDSQYYKDIAIKALRDIEESK